MTAARRAAATAFLAAVTLLAACGGSTAGETGPGPSSASAAASAPSARTSPSAAASTPSASPPVRATAPAASQPAAGRPAANPTAPGPSPAPAGSAPAARSAAPAPASASSPPNPTQPSSAPAASPPPASPPPASPPAGAQASITITNADEGKTFHVKRGGSVIVLLTATAGMQPWALQPPDPSILAPASAPSAGAGQTAQAYIAVAPGTATIAATGRPACQPGQLCPQFIRAFRATVVVDA